MTDTPLRMIQLQPDPYKVAAWMTRHGVTRPGHDDGYGWHAILTAAFGAHAPTPFRVFDPGRIRKNQEGCNPLKLKVLAYSALAKSELVDRATAFADPMIVEALGLQSETFADKQMPSRFSAGQCLGFEVFVRPTVRQDKDGDRRKSIEVDAFLAALRKADRELGPRGTRPDLDRETVYRDWLIQRLAPAAHLDRFAITQCERALLLRRPSRNKKTGEVRPLQTVGAVRKQKGEGGGGPAAVLSGTLTIQDPSAFSALLTHGIGRHRAFGFGMLLLKPAR